MCNLSKLFHKTCKFILCYQCIVYYVMTCCRALSQKAYFPKLRHLDMSGCVRLTGDALKLLMSVCPVLEPSCLYYCDNIVDGPFPRDAGGCRNLECSSRVCCRTGDWTCCDSVPEYAECFSWKCWCFNVTVFLFYLKFCSNLVFSLGSCFFDLLCIS